MWCIFLIAAVNVYYNAASELDPDRNISCGVDFAPMASVYAGSAQIETYPWLGMLYYPMGKTVMTTVVVLVTKQLVIGSAHEIDKVPKDSFRARSRVALGGNCTGPGIKVRDYTYHPEFEAHTYSALALVQLDVDDIGIDLFPICGPPTHFVDPRVFALTLNEGCVRPVVTIYEMEYVGMNECQEFYRRTELDIGSMWPTHATCARAVSEAECVWRGGTALAVKLGGRWHLLGFGVYGPGCRAPARFLEYGVYRGWVKTSVARMGSPAITRVGPDYIILRRKLSSIQRFGACDPEELQVELYTDTVTFSEEDGRRERKIKYNITIMESVEYSCVTFRVFYNQMLSHTPFLRLRRWCSKPLGICSGLQMIRIDFYVEIEFRAPVTFKLGAYGRRAKVLDPKTMMEYQNRQRKKPEIPQKASKDMSRANWVK